MKKIRTKGPEDKGEYVLWAIGLETAAGIIEHWLSAKLEEPFELEQLSPENFDKFNGAAVLLIELEESLGRIGSALNEVEQPPQGGK